MSKHTPLPWKANQCAVYGHGTPTGRETIIAVASRVQGVDPEVAVANAAFIVRACNSHDELMRTAIYALTTFRDMSQPDLTECEKQAIKHLEAALAKAEAQP